MRTLLFNFLLLLSLSLMACNNDGSTKVANNSPSNPTEKTPPQSSQEETVLMADGERIPVSQLIAEREKRAAEVTGEQPKLQKSTLEQAKVEIIKKEKTVVQPAVKEPVAIQEKTEDKKLVPAQNKEATPATPEKPKTSPTPPTSNATPATPATKVLSHETWDGLLRKYVSAAGKVNYKGIKADKALLETYLKDLADNPVQNDWPRGQKMAYWINAYNAFTVKLIVDNYPLSSITKLHGGKPWEVKWIKLGDKTYSLNQIENDILRPQFKDARIHFAVNCAAKSCPPLLNRAWTASNLEANFEKQAKAFINNSQYNQISANEVSLSKIFDWYGSDFGDLIGFLNKYAGTSIAAGAKVKFMEYDWTLNE